MSIKRRPIYLATAIVCSAFLLGPAARVLWAMATATSQTPAAPAEQKPSGPQSGGYITAPLLKVTTRFVVVDVVVTDKKGNAVKGLKADDFELLEEGRRETVRAFAWREAVSAQNDETQARRELPPGVYTNIPDIRPERGVPTILLVDGLNTSWQDQAYMRQELVKYLHSLGTRENIAVYTLSTRLRLVQDFTSDPHVLEQALKSVPTLATHPQANDEGVDAEMSRMATSLATNDRTGQIAAIAESLNQFQSDIATFEMDERVAQTLEALKRLARSVGGYPGRKNLVWLSSAFPLQTDLLTTTSFNARDYSKELRETADLLTDSQIAVYPVDAKGLATVDGASPAKIRAGLFDVASSHGAMDKLAADTGGRAYYNRNDIDHGIALSVEDGSRYYTLGYYPTNKDWDGKFRRIKVKVPKGLSARYRTGYFATNIREHSQDDEARAGKEFARAMSLESPAATTLPFAVRISLSDEGPAGAFVEFGVDPHAVIFEPQTDNTQQAKVQFVTVLFDSHGKVVNSRSDILATALTPNTFQTVMKTRLAVRQRIEITSGRYLLKAGVRDLKSNLIGTLSATVDVPPVAAK